MSDGRCTPWVPKPSGSTDCAMSCAREQHDVTLMRGRGARELDDEVVTTEVGPQLVELVTRQHRAFTERRLVGTGVRAEPGQHDGADDLQADRIAVVVARVDVVAGPDAELALRESTERDLARSCRGSVPSTSVGNAAPRLSSTPTAGMGRTVERDVAQGHGAPPRDRRRRRPAGPPTCSRAF